MTREEVKKERLLLVEIEELSTDREKREREERRKSDMVQRRGGEN